MAIRIDASLLTLPFLLGVWACDGSSRDPQTEAVEAMPQSSVSVGEDWEALMAAEVARVRTDEPQIYEALMGLAPRMTRAGFVRLTGPLLRHPSAAPLLLHRYRSGSPSSEVDVALIEALAHTGGVYGPALRDLYRSEQDARVREMMMAALRTTDADSALPLLGVGLADDDASVRAEAARTVARRSDGAKLASALIDAAGDADITVKTEAMRSLGALQVGRATGRLTVALEATQPEIRLNALRALQRIDPAYVAALPQMGTLVNDRDPRVAKAAGNLMLRLSQ